MDRLRSLAGAQSKIAEALGLSQEQVSRIATGKSPVPEYMAAVAELLEALPPKDWPARWRGAALPGDLELDPEPIDNGSIDVVSWWATDKRTGERLRIDVEAGGADWTRRRNKLVRHKTAILAAAAAQYRGTQKIVRVERGDYEDAAAT